MRVAPEGRVNFPETPRPISKNRKGPMPRLCTDCACSVWDGRGTPKGEYNYVCNHTEVIKNRKHFPRCIGARNYQGECGPDGRHFTERPKDES